MLWLLCVVCAVGMARLEGLPSRARAPSAPSPRLWNRKDSSQEVAGDKCQKRLVLVVVSRQRPHTEPLLEGHVKAVTWYRQPLGVCTPMAPASSLGAERPGSRTVDLETWADEQVAPLLLTLCSLGLFASRQTDQGAGFVAVWCAEFDLFACIAMSRIT